ncbi:MAG: PSD1 and planctomycete cytochrome C domain-containing protein, partial [Pirellulaceae bacterium]|nr:PSD1 and planctomycete cytochrome C domain-containing protein [Pirellulaceae bacterium]
MIRGVTILLAVGSGLVATGAEPSIDFSREIQPVFARRCYKCHGPNADEGGLRLSTREAATAELESGDRAVVPGDLKASTMMSRIRSTDESERMPPEGKPLTASEIAAIEKWIAGDAPWANHWSFAQLKRPAVPQPRNSDWVKSPIDAFILHRLEAANLQPAGPADKVALLRRAYYDLIGLPPTPAAVDAFLADESPRAFEKVVDNLLESKQYGEKWARHWLDLVRYAETNGYERDSRKDLIWKYRDYVIRAFNEDKPYDRFVQEQLAGDELPDKTGDSVTATGFYRLGIWDDEPADRPLARYDYLDDILRTTGETFLGMTIGCARCHDHKIDPLGQKDYYSMLSFFADISPHGKGGANHVQISAADDQASFDKKVAEKERRESMMTAQLAEIEREFIERLQKARPELKVKPEKTVGPRDGVVVADSRTAGQEWEFTTKKPADNWFEIAFDDSKWRKGPGGFGTKGTPGSVVRTEWRKRDIWLRKDFGLENLPAKLTLNIHHDEDAVVYLNGKQIASFKGYVTAYKQADVTAAALDVLQTGRNTLAIHCRQTGGGQYIDAGLVGDFSVTPTVSLAKKYGKEILGAERLAKWEEIRRELAASRSVKLAMKSEFVMAVAERGRQKTWILARGLPAAQGEEVGPAFPQILDPPPAKVPAEYATGPTTGKRRVLAEWITSEQNPVTARVIANRVWQHHYGRGIVRTTSDFGFQGSPPTHPALLDWLACELKANDWRLKKLHKQIMMSAAYGMSSKGDEQALARDPANNLHWRFGMRRLTAEEIRDSILAVTGELNLKMFGASTYPPLPKEVLATASRPDAAWGKSPPAEAARRTIYVHVKRSLRPPMLANFD